MSRLQFSGHTDIFSLDTVIVALDGLTILAVSYVKVGSVTASAFIVVKDSVLVDESVIEVEVTVEIGFTVVDGFNVAGESLVSEE